jgi:hypothetical protein
MHDRLLNKQASVAAGPCDTKCQFICESAPDYHMEMTQRFEDAILKSYQGGSSMLPSLAIFKMT